MAQYATVLIGLDLCVCVYSMCVCTSIVSLVDIYRWKNSGMEGARGRGGDVGSKSGRVRERKGRIFELK